MKAKEMFEELGYKADKYNDEIEQIFRKNKGVGIKEIVICSEGSNTYFKYDNDFEQDTTTYEEHLAISQKMKELGWLQ